MNIFSATVGHTDIIQMYLKVSHFFHKKKPWEIEKNYWGEKTMEI